MGDLQRCLQTPLQVLGHVCKRYYRSKNKISQFPCFFTYLHCLHLKLNPTYPHYFHSKFKTHLPPPIPTPVLIPTLSQLASSDFFSPFFFFFFLFFFPYLHSSVFLLFSFFFFFLSLFFTTHLDLFFSLPLHFDFISLVLFVVVLMLVGFGFENGVTASSFCSNLQMVLLLWICD